MTEPAEALSLAPWPSRKRYVLLLLVGLPLYFAIVWYLGWREVGETLFSARMSLVLATVGLLMTGNWLRATKWRYVLGPGHNAYALFFLSKVSAEWTPGRLGEFSPMLLRRHRTPRMGAWIVFDRLLEIFVTLSLGLAGLAIVRLVSPLAYTLLLVGALCGFAAVLTIITRRPVFLWVANRAKEGTLPHRFALLFAAISEEIRDFAGQAPLTLAITATAKVIDLAALVLLFQAFGFQAGFWLLATAKCALAIVAFVPITPMATGLPHLTQAGLMHYAADVPPEGLAVVIGVEVVLVTVLLWTSLGLCGLAKGRRFSGGF